MSTYMCVRVCSCMCVCQSDSAFLAQRQPTAAASINELRCCMAPTITKRIKCKMI